jgi:hypothetical protein
VPPIEIRPFQRSDREQLTGLVNAHIEVVLPACAVSVNAVMSQLEREPGEYVVDPWAVERATLVAVVRDRIVAAAHLVRYGAGERIKEAYRGVAEIRWLVAWPSEPDAGDAVAQAAVAQMAQWGAVRMYADGGLPGPAVYGVPDGWPHVRAIYGRAGFAHSGRVEVVLVAAVDALPALPDEPLTLRRVLGGTATRLIAERDGAVAGYVEVQTDLTQGGTLSRLAGWSELWELTHDDEATGTWLLAQLADWLRLARVDRVLHYGMEDEPQLPVWRRLARIERGWERG